MIEQPFGVTVICAAKNEEIDIQALLRSYVIEAEDNSELIIIDDSTDGTRQVVKNFMRQNPTVDIRLLEGNATGCCDARNKGMRNAKYSHISFMTADSQFPENYFEMVMEKFKTYGCKALMFDSFVVNQEKLPARFLHCWHENKKKRRGTAFSPLTTQGYCVELVAASKVGFIDTFKTDFNVCRDWTLVKKMDASGFSKHYDNTQKIPHIAPATISEFATTHMQRGLISIGYHRYSQDCSRTNQLLRPLLKGCRFFGQILTLKPLIQSSRMIKHSPRGIADFWPFVFLCLLKELSFVVGEFRGSWIVK